jgi:hypothetical protein
VEAKISFSPFPFMRIQASIGLSHPSAVEKRVFSTAHFTSFPEMSTGVAVGIGGIDGNLSGGSHLK